MYEPNLERMEMVLYEISAWRERQQSSQIASLHRLVLIIKNIRDGSLRAKAVAVAKPLLLAQVEGLATPQVEGEGQEGSGAAEEAGGHVLPPAEEEFSGHSIGSDGWPGK